MPLITVGGQTKDIGKTALVCNIITAFSRFRWTAVKFTTHIHKPLHCELLTQFEDVSIWEETHRGQDSDTARFLEAGAKEALLIESSMASLKPACDRLLKERDHHHTHVIVESTGAAEFLKPDLFLMLVECSTEGFKKTAVDHLKRADAVILREPKNKEAAAAQHFAANKPVFEARLHGMDSRLRSLIAELLDSGV